jgi:hypothetical protein
MHEYDVFGRSASLRNLYGFGPTSPSHRMSEVDSISSTRSHSQAFLSRQAEPSSLATMRFYDSINESNLMGSMTSIQDPETMAMASLTGKSAYGSLVGHLSQEETSASMDSVSSNMSYTGSLTALNSLGVRTSSSSRGNASTQAQAPLCQTQCALSHTQAAMYQPRGHARGSGQEAPTPATSDNLRSHEHHQQESGADRVDSWSLLEALSMWEESNWQQLQIHAESRLAAAKQVWNVLPATLLPQEMNHQHYKLMFHNVLPLFRP